VPYRTRSFWLGDLGDDALVPRPSLAGDTSVDVAVVGAGFTGLWSAYYLLEREPGLRVAVLEAEIAGFGASGRNGGWCSALLAMDWAQVAATSSRDAAIALQRAMFATVDEVGRVAASEGIDCHFAKGGTITLARSPLQLDRLRSAVERARRWGFGDDDLRLLTRTEARARIAAEGVHGARFSPHCAAIHPARLARGLARAVEARGGRIHERTRVEEISPGRIRTDHGVVRAEHVIRATEAYTARLPGERRTLAPLYSFVLATDPLPAAFWAEVGWAGRETLDDGRPLLIYAQRTADDRIVLGGRGAPYHFGSRIADRFEGDRCVHDELATVLSELFPSASGVGVAQRWGGPLGVPRDWFSSVGLDRRTGVGWAGGYVGDGVASSNLAGRTLADLVTGRESDLVGLPWVDHRSRRWEPEPWRWLGINAMLRLSRSADAFEARRGRPPRHRLRLLQRVVGH